METVLNTAVEHTYTLHREQLQEISICVSAFQNRTYIVGSVRVVVDTAEERGCRVLANVLEEQMATTRVLVDKVRDIVNEASDDDERPLDALVLDCDIY